MVNEDKKPQQPAPAKPAEPAKPAGAAVKKADEPLDVWLKPYERPTDNEAAMNVYLSWEVDLLERIKRDGTTHFLPAR